VRGPPETAARFFAPGGKTVVEKVMALMIEFFGKDAPRIHHFLKVYGFAQAIARSEGLDGEPLRVIELAALTHDIGIKPSEEKYGSSAGHYQELEGPAPARALLAKAGCAAETVERVAWLVAHHHSYSSIEDIDHQILVEADFLVNIYEDGMGPAQVASVREKVFKTPTGLMFLDQVYG
jgi:predicted metal-dependent HD superfamily phosphohydrolase